MMRVIVCGGRCYGLIKKERFFIYEVLDSFCDEFELWGTPDEYGNKLPEQIHIISGGAKGVDTVAIDWAVVNWVSFQEFKADWDKYGKSAGYKRNIQMLEEGKPDYVIAFPGGKGTAMMVEIARKAGVPTRVINNPFGD